jgi:hypothetical protein
MKSGLRISIKDYNYNFKTSVVGGKAGRGRAENYIFLK